MSSASNRVWRTFTHSSSATGNYGCCQIIDNRTRVIHLVGLNSHHLYRARLEQIYLSEAQISRALWPTASEKLREALPQNLAYYLHRIRSEDLPAPGNDRQMFSFTIYADGSFSWPAITLITRDIPTRTSTEAGL